MQYIHAPSLFSLSNKGTRAYIPLWKLQSTGHCMHVLVDAKETSQVRIKGPKVCQTVHKRQPSGGEHWREVRCRVCKPLRQMAWTRVVYLVIVKLLVLMEIRPHNG